jgi:hypothetical protein
MKIECKGSTGPLISDFGAPTLIWEDILRRAFPGVEDPLMLCPPSSELLKLITEMTETDGLQLEPVARFLLLAREAFNQGGIRYTD